MTLGFSRGSPGLGGGGIDFLRRVRDLATRAAPCQQQAARLTRWLALVLVVALLGLSDLAVRPTAEPVAGTMLAAPAGREAAAPVPLASLDD